MENLDIFQPRFVKVDEFFWWDLDGIETDAGTQFTSKEFKTFISVCGLLLTLAEIYR